MNWYKTSDALIADVGTPEELLDWMDCIEYGWMDKDHNRRNDFGDKFWDDYSMLLPDEVLKYKIGTCWDQTVFEHHVFTNQLGMEAKMIFIQEYKLTTHAFLLFRKGNKWFRFEHADVETRGIHGPYDTVRDAVEAVHEVMKEEDGFGYGWTEMDPADFNRKLTCKEFMDACGYDYEKMEETDKLNS